MFLPNFIKVGGEMWKLWGRNSFTS